MNEVESATNGAGIPTPQHIGGRPHPRKARRRFVEREALTHDGCKVVLIAIIRVAVLVE